MISVVVVNWNSGALLERCIGSLRTHAPECEIVLVDNDSGDSSLDSIRRWADAMILVRNRQNLGFAVACNQGWHTSHGELILFLNPDAECLPGAVEALERAFESDTGIWAAAGCLQDPSGKLQSGFNVRALPTIGSVAAEVLMLDEIWPQNPWTRRYRMTRWDHHSRRDVEQPAAACLMVRRTMLDLVGGFDEQFQPAWFEDVDLCKRIRDRGGRIVFEPEARFVHHGAVSLQSLSHEEFLRFYHVNQIRYFEKHFGKKTARRVRRLVVSGLYFRSLICCIGPLRSGRTRVSSRDFRRSAEYLSSKPGSRT